MRSVTLREIAKILGMHPSGTARYIDSHGIQCHKVHIGRTNQVNNAYTFEEAQKIIGYRKEEGFRLKGDISDLIVSNDTYHTQKERINRFFAKGYIEKLLEEVLPGYTNKPIKYLFIGKDTYYIINSKLYKKSKVIDFFYRWCMKDVMEDGYEDLQLLSNMHNFIVGDGEGETGLDQIEPDGWFQP